MSTPDCPLSRLYHEESKLTPQRARLFQERITEYSTDRHAVQASADAFKEFPTRKKISLPTDARWLAARKLNDVLRTRRSHRGPFGKELISLAQLGALLHNAAGMTGEVWHPEFSEIKQDLRAWPSGGALYPIETYLLALRVQGLSPGMYHYQPQTHALAHVGDAPEPAELVQLVYTEGVWPPDAAALLIFTAVWERTRCKYGERGYRITLLDCGHLAQNILLCAEDLQLAATPLGGFDDNRLAALLELDPIQEAPLHTILLGTKPR
jgi:SagB-type dehydrogenase family enzyme